MSHLTFRKIGLKDYGEFISAEDLEELLASIENLYGHVQPSILGTISTGLDEDNEK